VREIDFTFKFFGGDPVKNGRIHETIPPKVVHIALELSSVFAYVEGFEEYLGLRLDEHYICHEAIETGWSAERNDLVDDKRREIREIEKQNPHFQEEFTDHSNSVLKNYI